MNPPAAGDDTICIKRTKKTMGISIVQICKLASAVPLCHAFKSLPCEEAISFINEQWPSLSQPVTHSR